MKQVTKTRSAAVRERLNHPVVDGDGHFVEVLPVLYDYLREVGGESVLARYQAALPAGRHNMDGGGDRVGGPQGWYGLTPESRRSMRVTRGAFWPFPTKALDRATVMLPNLFRERMDDLGIDFAVLYPSIGLNFLWNPDEEIRRAGCRAFNRMCADLYGPHADRMTAVALIPMHTPEEAVSELTYAVETLGLKSVVLGSCIRRPIAAVAARAPEVSSFATWMDVLAVSSEHDYDPVWKKCVELGVAATFHTSLVGWAPRNSPDNFVYNHIGHFAASSEALCKALVIGGVPQRFPTLRFSFLEGGVGWACTLFNDLIEHWEKRNLGALQKYLNPANVDRAAMESLFIQYGGVLAERRIDALAGNPAVEDPAHLDDWSAVAIENPRAFATFFNNFYFGCEADDRMAAVAFNPKLNHYGTKLHAMFSSDVGHWDVTDITAVVAEAYELVEDGLLGEDDFREFSFANAVRLHGSSNKAFFRGTAIEDAAAAVLDA